MISETIYEVITSLFENLQSSQVGTLQELASPLKSQLSRKSAPQSRRTSMTIIGNLRNNLTSRSVSWKEEVAGPILPPPLAEYNLAQVSEHCYPEDCWIVIYDKVYAVSDFLYEHPGGDYIILEHAGRDATLAFRGSRHGKESFDIMAKYCIGILVESERIYTDLEGDCS